MVGRAGYNCTSAPDLRLETEPLLPPHPPSPAPAGVRIAEDTDLEGVTPQQAQQAAETLGASVELRRVMLCSAIADRNLRR